MTWVVERIDYLWYAVLRDPDGYQCVHKQFATKEKAESFCKWRNIAPFLTG